MKPSEFRVEVIRPVLTRLGLHTDAAELLLLATAIAESGLSALVQAGNGPALGVYQMEPTTHDDLWVRVLQPRRALAMGVTEWTVAGLPLLDQMKGNLYYATAMARIKYFSIPERLPTADIADIARYWKRYYNTHLGKGTEAGFIAKVQKGLK
jgi:hypothetical protein